MHRNRTPSATISDDLLLLLLLKTAGRFYRKKIAAKNAFRNYSVGSTETEDDGITLHILSNRRV